MTDHDTTPIPTDVLRAWVETVRPLPLNPSRGALTETGALYEAAVAALGPPRRPVTRDTPLGTEVAHAQAASEAHVIVGWDGDDALFRDEMGAYFADDPDGWYVVNRGRADTPENHSLPGTRVGDRMTEHTPVGATVEASGLRQTTRGHTGNNMLFSDGTVGGYSNPWTVVALPEESER